MILDCVNGKGTPVKMIVIIEAFETDLVKRAQECDVEVISFKEFEVWVTLVLPVLTGRCALPDSISLVFTLV